MSNVSVGHSVEQDRCKVNFHSPEEWRHLVSYQVAQSRTRGHSDEGVGFGSYQFRCDFIPFRTCRWIGSLYVSNVSTEPFFDHVLIRYKCCAFIRSLLIRYKCSAFI